VSGDFTIRLEQVFQGPMDLLLHLVREQEVEIHEIQIAKILDGYLAYLQALEELDIEYAGDFLVMAATLMAIKSRSLLPNEEVNLEEELDPRDELIQRLLEYRRFKEAGDHLESSLRERESQVARGWREGKAETSEREFDLGELTTWDLLATFSRLMRETLADKPHKIVGDARPMRFYVNEVVGRLQANGALSLRDLIDTFDGVPSREALVGSFCALLELVRLQVVSLKQDEPQDDIVIAVREDRAEDFEQIVRESTLGEEMPGSPEEVPEEDAGPVSPPAG
jgi:segregation and condensation protein A